MYKELDNYLLGYLPMDYWYDEGFSIAREILSNFTQEDWEELANNISSKTLDYQRKLAYSIENSGREYELSVLLSMTNTEDRELFEICIDSLREFINTENKHLFVKNEAILNHINRAMPNADRTTKNMYKDFLDKTNK